MQGELFYDNEYDALRATIDLIGGPKRIACALWPTKSMADARRYLLHCLDPERAEKLALEEIFAIWEMARAANVHVITEYAAQRLRYEFKAITPEEELNSVQREYVDAVKTLEKITDRMARLQVRAAG